MSRPTQMEWIVAQALADKWSELRTANGGVSPVNPWDELARTAIRTMRPISLGHLDAAGVNPLNAAAGCTVTDIWERLIDAASPPDE